jgi:apolipoprotein N-acyltransferase
MGKNLGIYRFPWLFAGYAFTERLLDGYAPLFGIYAVSLS